MLLGRFIPKVGKGAKADIIIILFLFSHKIEYFFYYSCNVMLYYCTDTPMKRLSYRKVLTSTYSSLDYNGPPAEIIIE